MAIVTENMALLSINTLSTTSKAKRRPPIYVALYSGVGSFGTVSTGDIVNQKATIFGADVAYLFNSWLGAGIKINNGICNVELNGDGSGSYRDQITFIGPSIHGLWAKERLEFTAGAAAGTFKWTISNVEVSDLSISNQSASSTGAFLWTGVNYMLTRNIGVALNIQSALGTVKIDKGLERNPAGANLTLGVNFRF